MADSTGISWTDATWNPIVGCTKVSPGCAHCYAETMAKRLIAMGQKKYAGTIDDKGRWTGQLTFSLGTLDEPLRWRKPRRVFVCSMSDLFHEAVAFERIDQVFAVMGCCPQHAFQVLTKRPDRMREYFGLNRYKQAGRHGAVLGSAHFELPASAGAGASFDWPLPNVWLGTSAEDQERADERIPHLLATPAAVRFVSLEPLLGPIDLAVAYPHFADVLDWAIIGGESGPGARPCQLNWIRFLVQQCREAGIATHVKQLGSESVWGEIGAVQLRDRAGADPSEWPTDLRIQEFPR